MLRGICKLPSLKDISPLIRSEQQTCFLSQKSKIKSAEHVPMSLHLPLRYWILCFDGHQSVGPWAYETQYLFLMTPKTFFFCVVTCPEINSLSESRRSYSSLWTKSKKKWVFDTVGYEKQERALSFEFFFHNGNYPWIHIDEKNNRLAKMILASEADVMK